MIENKEKKKKAELCIGHKDNKIQGFSFGSRFALGVGIMQIKQW